MTDRNTHAQADTLFSSIYFSPIFCITLASSSFFTTVNRILKIYDFQLENTQICLLLRGGVFLNFGIAYIPIYPAHVLVRIGGEVWIFFCISTHTKYCVHPTVQLVPVRSITNRVMVSPVRLVIYVVPAVSRSPVSELMVEEGQGVRPLPYSINERFPNFLPSHIHVWIKEHVTRTGHDC